MIDHAKVEHVVRLRLAHDKVNADCREVDDPNGAEKVGLAAHFWLEAENELSPQEFTLYMEKWQAERKNA